MRAGWIFSGVVLSWIFSSQVHAQLPRRQDFAVSIERMMGADYTFMDYDNNDNDDSEATLRLFINESERVPSNAARVGFDYFIDGLSLGIAGGFTTEEAVILAPRIGYIFQISHNFGFWLRGGFFWFDYGGNDANDWNGIGLYGDGLFVWGVASQFAFHFGPTLDFKFAGDGPEYVTIGIPQIGVTAWF